jgi:formylmethanofuran dehydrogenase subunit E
MVCFDYPEVVCSVCNEKFIDGYTTNEKGEIICEFCSEKIDNKV